METITGANRTKEMNLYMACATIEGFDEGYGSTYEDQVNAWSYLIESKYAWSLQGWYGRGANEMIRNGLIKRNGEIVWELARHYYGMD
jgi:hypothetical protein